MNREQHAQRLLYDRYKDAMYTILFRMLDDEDDAADALQEAFVEVFRSLEKYRRLSSLGAWIKVIVIRAGLAQQRTKKLDFEPITDRLPEEQSLVWDENMTGEYLHAAIRQLSPGYRNVFLLIEVEGYSHKEAAGLLQITEGTSKSQLFNAKKILQQKLKKLMY
ncbi:RNA polymerase sigma factor [Fulvivirgaceae bacterium PWU4]|uniref:RNA polymerase sigma factor n=2 Tax=Chryseosolibacter histidini TaxID=2782349 RepID=A0AAP2GPN6_9BACT|nr:RNA polymerase sigma factor [Chryseosolibacter histidini]